MKFYSGARFAPQDTVMDHKIYIVFPWQIGFSCLSLYAYCFRVASNNRSLHVCKDEVSTSAGEKCGAFSLQSGTSSTSSCLMRQWTQTSVCEEKNWKQSEEIRWSEDIYLRRPSFLSLSSWLRSTIVVSSILIVLWCQIWFELKMISVLMLKPHDEESTFTLDFFERIRFDRGSNFQTVWTTTVWVDRRRDLR